MVEHQNVEITDDEAALYDRQIRLWGIEAQKKLRTCRVLVAGLEGLGAEIAKNIVLAGIKSITLMDHTVLGEEDRCAQFLVSRDDVGKNRAQSSQARVQRLNPMVEVKVNVDDIKDQDPEFFDNFDVVCVVGVDKDTAVKINNICREKGIFFFAGQVFGFFGYMFSDLGSHEFTEEQQVPPVKKGTPPKKQKLDPETKIVKREVQFPTLEQALNVDWTTEESIKQLKKLSSSYFVLQILLQFVKLKGKKPSLDNKETDVATLMTLKNSLLKTMGIPTDKVDDSFAATCFGELSPLSAIVGGVLAQEIIKAVTHKDAPVKNFFFCNGVAEDGGTVESIGQ